MIDLSIIIPNFNTGELLRKTLTSIFSSSTDLSFEVLIMDNLSKDDPGGIVSEFESENLHFFSQADTGIYDAMNKGIQQAKGKWIYFMGSGDELLLDRIDGLPFDSTTIWMIYGNVLIKNLSDKWYDGEFTLAKLLSRNISHQSIFYNKKCFEYFGEFDLRFKVWSDYFMNLKIYYKYPERIKYADQVIANYLGGGISDYQKDEYFVNNKKKIILKLLLQNFTFSNLLGVYQYYSSIAKSKYFKY